MEISYADDIALIARSEQELKGMMRRFEKYIEKKGLILSPDKSKVIVFEKGRGRLKKREWSWREEEIEEVKEIRYLGYIMQKNGGNEKHIKERFRRATLAMNQAWSIGERLFKDDFGRRMKMFIALMSSVALYGAEIWGWGGGERIDKLKRKYIKWILGLDRRTPNYILMEETKEEEMRINALRRVIKYEEEARRSKKKIVAECIRELNKRKLKAEESKWEKRRREVLEKLEVNREDIQKKREEGETKEAIKQMMEDIKRKEKETTSGKINESKYNKIFKDIWLEEKPGYLKGKKKKKERSLIARYRCGNEIKGGHYWEDEEERKCRICKQEEETLEHVLKKCEYTKGDMEIEDFLNGDGRGVEIMKIIKNRRMERRKEEDEREEEEKEKDPVEDETI